MKQRVRSSKTALAVLLLVSPTVLYVLIGGAMRDKSQDSYIAEERIGRSRPDVKTATAAERRVVGPLLQPEVPSRTVLEVTPSVTRLALTNAFEVGIVHEPYIEDAFKAEPVEEPWASRVELLIYQQVSNSFLALVNITAECRSATCQVILTHPSTVTTFSELQPKIEQVRQMTDDLIRIAGPDLRGMTINSFIDPSQGVHSTTVYLHRNGERGGQLNMRSTPQPAEGVGLCIPIGQTCPGHMEMLRWMLEQ